MFWDFIVEIAASQWPTRGTRDAAASATFPALAHPIESLIVDRED
jgi:hypothetical protein